VTYTVSSILSTLEDALHDELKAAFAAFSNDVSSTDSVEEAAQRFGRHVANIKLAYQRANAIAKTEFSV
jgi:hypothetical protein